MTDHFKRIYSRQAERYEQLAAREDSRGNLFAALNDIISFAGLDVVEFGAGTGRLTRLIAVIAARVFAFDFEPAMLAKAASILRASGLTNWSLTIGDNARMPVASGCADLVIEGWSFAHVMEWHPLEWRRTTDAMLAEMRRLLKPGGTAVLIETLGTGRRRPRAPSPELARLYRYWENDCGFNQRWIRTDFQFDSPEEADELMRFFFGDQMAEACLDEGAVIVPECTGIWWRQYES